MIDNRPLISTSSSPSTSPLVTVPRAPITTDVTVTFMFYNFFRSRYLSFFQLSFQFYSVVCWDSKVLNLTIFFFCWLSLGLVIWARLDDSLVCQNHREVFASHSTQHIISCEYTICSYGQISISCTILCQSLSHPVVSSLILFQC